MIYQNKMDQNTVRLHFIIVRMYHHQQNKCYPKGVRLSEKLQLTAHSVIKFDRIKKFELCYYGQEHSLS